MVQFAESAYDEYVVRGAREEDCVLEIKREYVEYTFGVMSEILSDKAYKDGMRQTSVIQMLEDIKGALQGNTVHISCPVSVEGSRPKDYVTVRSDAPSIGMRNLSLKDGVPSSRFLRFCQSSVGDTSRRKYTHETDDYSRSKVSISSTETSGQYRTLREEGSSAPSRESTECASVALLSLRDEGHSVRARREAIERKKF